MKGYEDLYEPVALGIIKTRYGWMNVLEPTEDMVSINDIAHSLSHQCRFGGHTQEFYSVAQHSVVCNILCKDAELKLAMLLHDASEAYLLDIPRPVKLKLANYKEIEDKLMTLIAKKYGFEWPLHPKVKEMDEHVLRLEWDNLMKPGMVNSVLDSKDPFIDPMKPWYAKELFLSAYKLLTS